MTLRSPLALIPLLLGACGSPAPMDPVAAAPEGQVSLVTGGCEIPVVEVPPGSDVTVSWAGIDTHTAATVLYLFPNDDADTVIAACSVFNDPARVVANALLEDATDEAVIIPAEELPPEGSAAMFVLIGTDVFEQVYLLPTTGAAQAVVEL